MDPNFKKIIENTYINNNYLLPIMEIKKQLFINIRIDKLKDALKLIYNKQLREIKQDNKTYFNINVSKNPIRNINNNVFLFNLNDMEYIKNNHNTLTSYFKLISNPKTKLKTSKKLNNISNDLIYYCLAIGIPINYLSFVLNYSSTRTNNKTVNKIYNSKMEQYKKINNYCTNCNNLINLSLHHIQTKSQAPYLKYNPYNWLIVCRQCHNKIHNK